MTEFPARKPKVASNRARYGGKILARNGLGRVVVTYLTNMYLARASEAAARRLGSLYFTGLLQTHTNSGLKDANRVPPVDVK